MALAHLYPQGVEFLVDLRVRSEALMNEVLRFDVSAAGRQHSVAGQYPT